MKTDKLILDQYRVIVHFCIGTESECYSFMNRIQKKYPIRDWDKKKGVWKDSFKNAAGRCSKLGIDKEEYGAISVFLKIKDRNRDKEIFVLLHEARHATDLIIEQLKLKYEDHENTANLSAVITQRFLKLYEKGEK